MHDLSDSVSFNYGRTRKLRAEFAGSDKEIDSLITKLAGSVAAIDWLGAKLRDSDAEIYSL